MKSALHIAALLCLNTLMASACGSDPAESELDASSADATTSADASLACQREGFVLDSQRAERDDDLGVLFYTASRGSAPTIEYLTIDLYFSLGAVDGPQEFSLSGENLADCNTCVLMRSECDADGCANGKSYLAQSGTLSLSSVGAIGNNLQGSLQTARFAEVTISGDLQTTLVPGGESWCVDEYVFDAPVTAPQ